MKKLNLFLAAICLHLFAHAQNVFPSNGSAGIGTSQPHPSSILELRSNNKGLLIPRMAVWQRNAIPSPPQGLLVYQTDGSSGLWHYNGGWKPLVIPGANTYLSNLTSSTRVNVNLNPKENNLLNFGSENYGWKHLYMTGNLYLNKKRFITSKDSEIYIGDGAGNPHTTGFANIAIGNFAFSKNRDAFNNLAIGHNALMENTTGGGNVAVGNDVLLTNTDGIWNVGLGIASLHRNTTGAFNIGIGAVALPRNIDGVSNLGIGTGTLIFNEHGWGNVALGDNSLLSTTKDFNIGIGVSSGYFAANVTQCTFIGTFADGADNLVNSTALGYEVKLSASNQVRIGNANVTSIGGYANWTNISDARVKTNVVQDVPGLSFISLLRPVTYTLNLQAIEKQNAALITKKENPRELMDKKKPLTAPANSNSSSKAAIVYTGFVAQEVEKAAKDLNYSFSGVDVPENKAGLYGLRYAEFVVPLVKAVQELDSANKAKDERIAKLEQEMLQLKDLVGRMSNNPVSGRQAWMQQNVPNPSIGQTTIAYYVPEQVRSARILLTDTKGRQLQYWTLSSGSGQVLVSTSMLAAGTYHYSLVTDGKTITTMKMIIAK